jgi:hypothetical protein
MKSIFTTCVSDGTMYEVSKLLASGKTPFLVQFSENYSHVICGMTFQPVDAVPKKHDRHELVFD